jgi:hypothetical protein
MILAVEVLRTASKRLSGTAVGGSGIPACAPWAFRVRRRRCSEISFCEERQLTRCRATAWVALGGGVWRSPGCREVGGVDEHERARIGAIVDDVLAAHRRDLKMTLGRMVYEIQPDLNWDKGRAVLYLLEALDGGCAVALCR